MTCWPGVTERVTSAPTARSRTCSTKALHHFERHVGLEQRAADFAQRRIDVGFAQRAAARQAIEDFPKPVAKALEHAQFPVLQHWAAGYRLRAGQTPNPPEGASRCRVFASGISLDLCGSRSAVQVFGLRKWAVDRGNGPGSQGLGGASDWVSGAPRRSSTVSDDQNSRRRTSSGCVYRDCNGYAS